LYVNLNFSINLHSTHILCQNSSDRIDGVLSSNVVDRRFEPHSGQSKDNKIGICCFSAKHVHSYINIEPELKFLIMLLAV
jgi:hypothetical protein